MKLGFAASLVHKWLALVVMLPILFWVASGLFFAINPIERVRSEHRLAAAAPVAVDTTTVLAPSALTLPQPPTKLTLQQGLGGPQYVAEFGEGVRPVLIDAMSGRQLSPLNSDAASAAALAALNVTLPVQRVDYVIAASPEYRGLLPAWRVAFVDEEGLAVYVSADTGQVTARRSNLWRLYDALWAFHIMDFRDHENFNNALLIVSAAMALIMSVAGIILLPYRLRLPQRR
ncbi:MAG: PepSY domain-containing protein [Hyphomonadaceae bacterium]|nr:PepSY domain-containing protein [Hyphomonadaceae bacterium]